MPIDVSYPATLIEDILKDATPIAICVQEDMAVHLKGTHAHESMSQCGSIFVGHDQKKERV